ncbi:hypothetical protein GCM10009609_37450 [Pseudonocardia aurantiaca]|uniref:Uncharacterized protein n=1 Tax=Pseudonocardia aurantiaca TaxID=75290 RepID=A0ABW4FM31_9PSEU
MLKAVDWRWNLPPLTPCDSAARNIAEVLDFSSPPDPTAPTWPMPPVVALDRVDAAVNLTARLRLLTPRRGRAQF